MSYAGCPGPSLAILVQFILKMCGAVENCQKNLLETPVLVVQGH